MKQQRVTTELSGLLGRLRRDDRQSRVREAIDRSCSLGAVDGSDARRCDAIDAVGDQLDIGTVERRVEVVRYQRPLTAVGLHSRPLLASPS